MIDKTKEYIVDFAENYTIYVSVIVPVYNSEEFLPECLEALSKQSLRKLEIILVDDGSVDSTGRLCDEFAERDSRVRVLHTPNGGVSLARQTGLNAASGEYVVWADGDDWMESDMYEKLYDAAKSSNADFVWCGYIAYPAMRRCTEDIADEATSFDCLEALVTGRIWGATWNKLYKRKVIVDNNITFPENLKFCEDLVFNLRFLKYAAKVSHIRECLYYYRTNPNSIMHKMPKNIVQQSLTILHLVENELENTPPIKWSSRLIQNRRDQTTSYLITNRRYVLEDIRNMKYYQKEQSWI